MSLTFLSQVLFGKRVVGMDLPFPGKEERGGRGGTRQFIGSTYVIPQGFAQGPSNMLVKGSCDSQLGEINTQGPPVGRAEQPAQVTECEGCITETPRAGRGSVPHPLFPEVLLCAGLHVARNKIQPLPPR